MTVISITRHPRYRCEREPELSKGQLSKVIGFSPRWIELRHHDGLPVRYGPNGYARYLLSEVEPWIAEWFAKKRERVEA